MDFLFSEKFKNYISNDLFMNNSKHPGMGKEFPHTDEILPLSAIVFSLVWGLDSFIWRFSEPFVGFIPNVIRILLFLGFEATALALGISSHNRLFGKNTIESTLITDGIFAYVRHPLYLSILLTYLGFVFGAISLLSLIPWVFYVLLFDKMASFEEVDLVRIFGEKYVDYQNCVPKWIPRLLFSKKEKKALNEAN